jgi:uncharacterized repeat protein (TIGR01451 family)
VQLDVPWLELQEQAEPRQPGLHGSVYYTFTVRNRGVAPATGHLTDTLPSGLAPIAGSAWASTGEATLVPGGLIWSGDLAPGAQATISYRAQVTLARLGARLIDRAALTDQYGRRVVAWTDVRVPAQFYLPLIQED